VGWARLRRSSTTADGHDEVLGPPLPPDPKLVQGLRQGGRCPHDLRSCRRGGIRALLPVNPQGFRHGALALEFLNFCYEHGQLSANTGLGLVSRISQFKAYENKPGFNATSPCWKPSTRLRPRPGHIAQWQQIVNEVLVPCSKSPSAAT